MKRLLVALVLILCSAVTATPAVFSPWMVLQVRELGPHLPTGAPSPGAQHDRSTR